MRLTTLLSTIVSLFAATAVSTAATVNVSSWVPIFEGIDAAYATLDGVDYSVAHAVRVDLTASGIGFLTTPHSGPLQTVSETTAQFVGNTGVAVAINANFFSPCCNAFAEPKDLIGLAISNGALVSPPNATPGNSNVALLLTATNVASIQTTGTGSLSNVYNAVAGSAIIVQNGQNIGSLSPSEGDPTHTNPRTDVGISQDGRYLYLVAIDGRQPGYSIGTTIPETADIMIALGSYTAMNLDGGGSTSLDRAGENGGVIELNQPSGGAERYDGNHLGVFAAPLVTPEPLTAALFGLGTTLFGMTQFWIKRDRKHRPPRT